MADIDSILVPYTPDERLLPYSIRDERSLALLHLMWGLVHFDKSRLNVYNIDAVDSSVLPHLVQQFRLERFIPDGLPEDRLRQVIKRAIELWRYLGTRYGMQLAVEAALGVDIEFQEWWQLNSTPHTFTVAFSLDGSQDAYIGDFGLAFQNALIKLVNATKPVRSHLLRLDLSATTEADVRMAVMTDRLTMTVNFVVRDEPEPNTNPGIGATADTTMIVV